MPKSILYVGSLNTLSNSFKRYNTLGLMGHMIRGIDVDPFIYGSVFKKFHHHFNIGPGIKALNQKILKALNENATDILWVDNKPYLTKSTLNTIKRKWPALKIIDLITDDPTGRYKRSWRLCLRTAKYFDIHFVQRIENVAELKNYGAQKVEICYRSYDPIFHRPVILKSEDEQKYKVKVGFVGTHETYRESFIVYLIKNGIEVSVTGNDWQNAKQFDIIRPFYRGPSVYGEDYIKSINGMGIALHFLRHVNRDEQDSRTFEIPACGIFMLAEKSDVHLSLFKDGSDAVFFETKEELLNKVKYYLAHEDERKFIASNGLKRVRASGYSHEDRLKDILHKIYEC